MKKMIGDSTQIMGRWESRTRDEMVEMLDENIATLPEEQRASVTFEIDEYGYQYDDNTYYALFMRWQRLETDVEEAQREAQEAAMKEQQLQRDREQFERLKKQFGE